MTMVGKTVLAQWRVHYSDEVFRVRCRVLAERSAYGQTELRLTPIEGDGERWFRSTWTEDDLPSQGKKESHDRDAHDAPPDRAGAA